MKKYIKAGTDIPELLYTIVLECEFVDARTFKAASTDISDHSSLPTYAEVLDYLSNTAPTLIDTKKFIVDKSHDSDASSYYAKLSAIGPEGYIVTEPIARVRFASHVNHDERKNVVNNDNVKNITDGYSSLDTGKHKVRLIRAWIQCDTTTIPDDVRIASLADATPKYMKCNSLFTASDAIKNLLNFAYSDLIACKEKCTYRTCTLSKLQPEANDKEQDLWQICTKDNRRVADKCEFEHALKLLDRKEIKNSTVFDSDEDILDSIGNDIIDKLSSKYPDIEFYLIDIYSIKNLLYFEYNSSAGYHECITLNTDFSRLSDTNYYNQTVNAIYDYICDLFDADDDDSYFFDD